MTYVMLVEIPDVGVILGIAGSFVIGLVSVSVYNRLKPRWSSNDNNIRFLKDRLQNYENLLIDMKIKLDTLELVKDVEESVEIPIPKQEDRQSRQEKIAEPDRERPKERVHNMNFGSAVDYVLRLIMEKPMTSRDIQITIGRTREHTSRMMKKLYEEGLVERNRDTKPFSYRITEKGLSKIAVANPV